MHSLKSVTAGVFLLSAVSCGDPLSPHPGELVGKWRNQSADFGGFVRELDFSRSGHYIATVRLGAGAYSSNYGHYSVNRSVLRMVQDSAQGWDPLTGEWRQVGTPMYIEGPPTDPDITLSRRTLVLRFFVNPGNGYAPVRVEYRRVG